MCDYHPRGGDSRRTMKKMGTEKRSLAILRTLVILYTKQKKECAECTRKGKGLNAEFGECGLSDTTPFSHSGLSGGLGRSKWLFGALDQSRRELDRMLWKSRTRSE